MIAWAEAVSDPHTLSRCIRHLVALSTLLAIWRDCDTQQMAAALLPIVGADFVYISLPDRYGMVPIDVLGRRSPVAPEERLRVREEAVGRLSTNACCQGEIKFRLVERRSRS